MSDQLGSSFAKKALWIKMNTRLTMSQQRALAVKASGILGCIKWNVPSNSREVTLPLCSALLRPQLDCCVQLWAHLYKRDMNILKNIRILERPQR